MNDDTITINIDEPDKNWFDYCEQCRKSREFGNQHYESLVEKVRLTDNLKLRINILSALAYLPLRCEKVPEIIHKTFLLQIDKAVRASKRKESTVFSDYELRFDEHNVKEVKSRIRQNYDSSIGFTEIYPDFHYLVVTNDGDILAEIVITDEATYLSEYLHFSEYSMSENQLLEVRTCLKGLINSCRQGSVPSPRIIDRCLFLINKIPDHSTLAHSCALIEKYAEQNSQAIISSQSVIFDSLINAHEIGYERAFKTIYKISSEIQEDIIVNRQRIIDHLKTNIYETHGGERKMCRRAISNLTGENKIKIYYKELRKEL